MKGTVSNTMNSLFAEYLENPKERLDVLLAAVHRLAKRTLHDDDHAQELAIFTWRCLSDSESLPCSFGEWIWRQLQWRRIDHVRARQYRLRHEMQPPEMMDESDDPLSAEEALEFVAHWTTSNLSRERIGKLAEISDPFIRQVAQELIAGYTQDEIALRMGCNPSTLRSRLSRYRRGNPSTSLKQAS